VSPGPSVVSGRTKKLYGVVFLVAGIAVAANLWGARGPVLAVLAALTFGTIAAGVLIDPFRVWLRKRPYLDASLMLPASFSLVAFLTDLPLSGCLTIAVFLWLVLIVAVTWRRQREALEERGVEDQRGRRPGERPDQRP
jgi:hypothetical protein